MNDVMNVLFPLLALLQIPARPRMPLIPSSSLSLSLSLSRAQCRALWLVFGRPAGGSRGERADWLVPLRLGSVVDHIDRDDALSRWRASS